MRAKTIFAAAPGVAILGLQACFFESPYGSQPQYGQYGSGAQLRILFLSVDTKRWPYLAAGPARLAKQKLVPRDGWT